MQCIGNGVGQLKVIKCQTMFVYILNCVLSDARHQAPECGRRHVVDAFETLVQQKKIVRFAQLRQAERGVGVHQSMQLLCRNRIIARVVGMQLYETSNVRGADCVAACVLGDAKYLVVVHGNVASSKRVRVIVVLVQLCSPPPNSSKYVT